MSRLGTDSAGMTVQAFMLPATGKTTKLNIGAGVSAATPALTAGWYEIVADTALTIVQGPAALVTDKPLRANVEQFWYIKNDGQIAAFNNTGGTAVLYATLMPAR